jgi:hypothetical protein
MANTPTESENRYAEALAQARAKEIVKGKKNESEADELINKILDTDELHVHNRERFRQMVMKKVEEMKQKAHDDREKKIVEEYEGKLLKIDGDMLRPSGVQKDFKVRVRAGKFEIGNIGRRIWGHSVNADKLGKMVDEIKEIETQIEENKIRLEMLKSARTATATVVGVDRLGMTVEFTKASLIKDIYRNKMKSKGWTSLFSTDLNLWDSYKAAKELKEKNQKEYAAKDTGGKATMKQIEERGKQLENKKAVLEAALKRVEDLREHGRQLFTSAFGEQLAVLQRNRDMMDDDDYKRHAGDIREKVKAFGKSMGIVNMEYFLNEALGIKPEISSDGKVVYEEPQTSLEKERERVKVVQWWEKNFGKKASESEITSLIASLRKEDPELLREMVKGDSFELEAKIDTVIKFLFSGRMPGTAGKEVLAVSRRAILNVENVMKYLKIAKKVSAEFKGKDVNKLTDIFTDFAEKLPSRYKAVDFEYIYPSIDSNVGRDEIKEEREKEHNKELAEVWEKLTGLDLYKEEDSDNEKRSKVNNFYTAINYDGRIKVGPDVFLEQINDVKPPEDEFIKLFFTGEFDDTSLLDEADRFKPNPHNVLDVYQAVHALFQLEKKPDKKELKALGQLIKDRTKEKSDKVFFKDHFNKEHLKNGTIMKSLKLALTTKVREPKNKGKKNK